MKDGSNTWVHRMLSVFLFGLTLPGGGCVLPEQFTVLADQVEKLRETVEAQHNAILKLKEASEMALVSATCHQDVLELLRQVSSACDKGAEFCELTKIPLAIMEADPTHEGRFVTMMTTQRHAAIYFLKGIDDPWLNTFNQQHFSALLSQRRLLTTKVLVVANVDNSKKQDRKLAAAENRLRIKEARDRLNIVVQRIRGLGISDENMVTMVFPFTLKKAEHLGVDDKQPPGALELSNSVWIFLTNCFPEKSTKQEAPPAPPAHS